MTNSTNDAYTQAANWLVATAKGNPEALLVLGAGLALLMRGRGRASSSARPVTPFYGNEGNAERPAGWRDGISRAAEGVSDYAADVATDVKDRVTGAATAATQYAANVGGTISSETTRLAGQAQTAIQSGAGQILEAQPLAVAAFGIAAGAALAALIPATAMEVRTLGSTREVIADAANKVGEHLFDAAGEAGERLKQGAADRGLSSDGLKGLAHDVADTFTGKVSGSAKAASD